MEYKMMDKNALSAALCEAQKAYDAYCALTAAQQSLLPDPAVVFKPYFDYFNSLVSLLWSGAGTQENPFSIRSEQELRAG